MPVSYTHLAKLLQYGERIWGLTEGSEDERIDQAIAKTKAFFETMNLKTNLSDHGLTRDNIPEILDSLRAHDMVRLGEDQDVTPEVEMCIRDRPSLLQALALANVLPVRS